MYKISRKQGGLPNFLKGTFTYEQARMLLRKYAQQRGYRGRSHLSLFAIEAFLGLTIRRV